MPPHDPDTDSLDAFRRTVWAHHAANRRDLPWRRTRDPYRILVSEFMLQQTQVPRVLPKYEAFLQHFPDVARLAAAPLADVLALWQGLGYNRRAVALKRLAEMVVRVYGAAVPRDRSELLRLPGVGPATASAVAAFAFDDPHPFIETNIRAVYLHHFFPDRTEVPDAEILPLVEATLDRDDPREWYYALMDYGVALKRDHPNPGRRSRHHARQSPFAGSHRELRARVLRVVLDRSSCTAEEVATALSPSPVDQVADILDELAAEGFMTRDGAHYHVR